MPDFDVDPQGFWWHPEIDLATLKKKIKDSDGRLVSLDAFVTGGQLRFCAAWIPNVGDAKATWDWDNDISPKALGEKMTNLPGRITCLSSYMLGGNRRYAAVWVKNIGTQAKGWWWHPDLDPETVGKDLKVNNGRLISLDVWLRGGAPRCAAVWISNTGADAAASWWHPGVDAETLGGFLANNKGRIVCLDAYKVGEDVRYAAAWIENTGAHNRAWSWWHDLDEKQLGQKFDLFCCYTADVRSYPIAGGKRHLAAVLYAGRQPADPNGAALLAASGTATLTKVSVDNSDTTDAAALHQWMNIEFNLKNVAGSNAKVTLAELYAMESGGFIYADAVENALGGFFTAANSTIAAGATLTGSGTRQSGFGIAHYLLRWHAESRNRKQRGFATVPVVRAGFVDPPAISITAPVYLALWTKPAELVPMWIGGKKKTWLSLGGQIVNVSGKPLRFVSFQVMLTVDGKVLVDQPVTAQMRHFVPSATAPNKDLAVVAPPVDGVQELEEFVTYFADGFEVDKVPSSFQKALLRLVLNYKIGDRCGTAVLDAPVVRLDPLVLEPPLKGKWWFGNSPNHVGLDPHAWPGQRFSIDFAKRGDDNNFFKDAEKMNQNSNFWAYGQTVYAMASGLVIESIDINPDSDGTTALQNGKANYVLIHHNPDQPGSFYHGYYHLRPGRNKVAAGIRVEAGDEIGQVGNSGANTPHLHLGIGRLDETGRGTMVPMAFKGLKDGTTSVTDVPGTGEYTH